MIKKILLLSFCLIALSSVCWADMPQVYQKSEECPADKPFKLKDSWQCRGCDTFHSMKIAEGHEVDFEICEEREIIDGYSRLKQCPQNFARDIYGNCQFCDEVYFFPVAEESDCGACPNREVGDKWQHDSKEVFRCQLKTCPESVPLSAAGDCFACDAKIFPDNAKEACEKCPDRMFLPKDYTIFQNDEKRWYINEDTCIVNPPKYSDQVLVDLSTRMMAEIVQKEKKKIQGDSIVADGTLVLLEFDKKKEDMGNWEEDYRRNFKYATYSCENDIDVVTLPEMCTRCPNREFKDGDGHCILKNCPEGMIRVADDLYFGMFTKSVAHAGREDEKLYGTEYSITEQCEDCSNRLWMGGVTTRENCYKCPDTFFEEPTGRVQLLGNCHRCYDIERNPEYAAQAFAQGRCLEWQESLKKQTLFEEKEVVLESEGSAEIME